MTTQSEGGKDEQKPLAGEIAFVTGGSRGTGRRVAVKLAARGAKVVLNYIRNEEAAQQTLARVREKGSEASSCKRMSLARKAWITGQTIVADGGVSLMSPEIPIDFQRA